MNNQKSLAFGRPRRYWSVLILLGFLTVVAGLLVPLLVEANGFGVRGSATLGESSLQPILFISNRDGNNEIYRMNADGSERLRLTESPEPESQAKWAPDGTSISFLKLVGTGSYEWWVMDPDGSNKAMLTSFSGVNGPTIGGFSPDRQSFLYGKKDGFVETLWRVDVDGSITQLTDNGTADHIASWSSDGSKIVFGRCTADGNYVCDIYTMNSDGSEQTNLTSDNPNDDDAARWTPDGERILYSRISPDAESYDLFIMNSDGSEKQLFVAGDFVLNYNVSSSAVSPDGNSVALYVYLQGPPAQTEVFSVPISGGTPQNLTNNSAFDFFGLWSPDSSKIGFISRRDSSTSGLYIMNADGSNVVRLTQDNAVEAFSDWCSSCGGLTPTRIVPYDFDGDSRSDISVFRRANGQWWHLSSDDGNMYATTFGLAEDVIVPGDYSGDGIADHAVFRPSSGNWYIQMSSGEFSAFPFGLGTDIPVPADYDGDGKTDVAVYRPSNGVWYIMRSSDGGVMYRTFGGTTDKPVPVDYDGDGKADIAVFRPIGNSGSSEWWIVGSANDELSVYTFGSESDIPVPADHTGDRKADIAVFRPSNGYWYVLQSDDGQYYGFHFGMSGDVPVVADYDGDGRSDAGVFRPTESIWYINLSSGGQLIRQFGTSTDSAVPAAYNR